jgi:hypothetical protein
MKANPKLAGMCLVGLLLVGSAGLVLMQHQDLNQLRQENRALQEQVAALHAELEKATAEQEGLTKQIAEQRANAGTSSAQEQSSELLQLRGEVGRLHLEERASDEARQAQMQAAQAKVQKAESDFAQLSKLRSENLVSVAEVEKAKFGLELLKAEARGDSAAMARIRLEQAEAELTRATELRKKFVISQAEYEEALRKVESLRSGAEPGQ